MKLWEVIKELTENPKKKFVFDEGGRIYTMSIDIGCNSNFFTLSAINDKGECISNLDSGRFNGNFTSDDDNWQLVRQPVTWQEAIQAWAENGKTIRVEFENGNQIQFDSPHKLNTICPDDINLGKWYVED